MQLLVKRSIILTQPKEIYNEKRSALLNTLPHLPVRQHFCGVGVIMAKKNKTPKTRNWLAVHAHFKSGAGHHGDKKKEKSKKACRGKVRV